MNWVQINIQVNEDFRYMKIHIFALRWRDEIGEKLGEIEIFFFFQVLFTTTRFSSVLSCEDLLISLLYLFYSN